MPPAAAAAAHQRCRKVAKRKGWTPSAATLFLTGWMMVFTAVPPEAVDGPAVLAFYRCRWQVELMFKRLKSLLDLDHLRTQRNSVLGSVWILGKWLYALVIERHIQRQSPLDWDRLDQPRRVTPWRLVALARRQVDAWILEVHRWRPDRWAACLEVIAERPRRRRLQTLPVAVIALLNTLLNQIVA
nr:transposase [Thiocystis violacea]